MNICSICLHTDREMKVSTKLSEYHDELCGISLSAVNSYYCFECEFLLVKFFKFKRRCLEASEIYHKWTSAEVKEPIDTLYTQLPPYLNVWMPGDNIANIDLPPYTDDDETENDNENSYSTIRELLESPYVEVKIERDQTNHIGNINDILNDSETAADEKTDNNIEKLSTIEKLEADSDDDRDFDDDSDDTLANKKLKLIEKRLAKLKKDKTVKKENDFDTDHKKSKKSDDSNETKYNGDSENDNFESDVIDLDDLSENDVKSEKLDVPIIRRKKLIKRKGDPPNKRKVTSKKKVAVKTEEKSDCKKTVKSVKKQKEGASKKQPLEKTKEALIEKLSAFGEVTLEDGIAVNEDLVAKLLERVTGTAIVRSLWQAECREDVIELIPKIKHALKEKKKPKRTKPIKGVDRRVKKLGGVYETIFDIEYLKTPAEKLEEFQRRKTYEHYIKADTKCEICYQVFRGRLNLETHIRTYHDETKGDWVCPICKMRFPLKSRIIRNHKQSHHAVYRCKLCPLLTYHRGRMKEHTAKHQGKTYRCEPCSVTYNCISAYYAHLAAYHRRGRIVCSHCGRGFPSEKSLEVHSSLAHKETPPIPQGSGVWCEECDVTLASQEVYEAHIYHVHQGTQSDNKTDEEKPGSRPWPKPVRGEHLQRAPGREPNKQKCRVCNVSRVGAGWLKAHFRWEHPDLDIDLIYADLKVHLCDVCGVGLRCLTQLRDHMNLHTGSLPHACDICPKRFRSVANLKNHRLHHFPPAKPCPQCGKKFKTNSNLYNHMKGHAGERRYKCNICEKGFLSSAALNEHVRGVHFNIRRVRGQRGKSDTGVDGRSMIKRSYMGVKRRRPDSDQFESDSSE